MNETTATQQPVRSLETIAREIRKHWKNVYFGAVPYLEAMGSLNKVTDQYGCEDGKTQVIYFLSNATGWRGEDAKRIKAELKKMIGVK